MPLQCHHSGVIMSAMASQITGVSIVRPTVCSRADQRKHQNSASLAFVRGIYPWPLDFPHKGPVTRKMFPFDDVIMFLLFFKAIQRVGAGSSAIKLLFGLILDDLNACSTMEASIYGNNYGFVRHWNLTPLMYGSKLLPTFPYIPVNAHRFGPVASFSSRVSDKHEFSKYRDTLRELKNLFEWYDLINSNV